MVLEVNWNTFKKKSRFCHHWEALALCTLLLSEDAFVTLLHHIKLPLWHSNSAAVQHLELSTTLESLCILHPPWWQLPSKTRDAQRQPEFPYQQKEKPTGVRWGSLQLEQREFHLTITCAGKPRAELSLHFCENIWIQKANCNICIPPIE